MTEEDKRLFMLYGIKGYTEILNNSDSVSSPVCPLGEETEGDNQGDGNGKD